jgi:hypothetical protein
MRVHADWHPHHWFFLSLYVCKNTPVTSEACVQKVYVGGMEASAVNDDDLEEGPDYGVTFKQ